MKIKYIPEEDLIFGRKEEEKDPRIGLKYFGPVKQSENVKILDRIKVGLIGDKICITRASEILQLLKSEIKTDENNKWLYPDYPGMNSETKFGCVLETSSEWQEIIKLSEIEEILKIGNANERIGLAVNMYLEKINNIVDEDSQVDVIICIIPSKIDDYCGISEKTRGAKTPKMTRLEKQIRRFKRENQSFLSEWGIMTEVSKDKKTKGYDLRNSLKGKLMSIKSVSPIQLLKESTANAILNYEYGKKQSCQEPASFAWNFSTALFYKANGHPWRLAKLRTDTCYVGISFYQDKLSGDKNMQTSMAQVFTHTGDGLVLKGTDVYIDEISKEPHLTESQSKSLMQDIISRYEKKTGRNPTRVVIHKKTLFSESEIRGFDKSIGNLQKDFVTISKRNKGIRFMRIGTYPVLRGTLVSLTDQKHILYSSGYTPRVRTYPGHSIPQPLFINHIGDTQIQEIATEILGLTKLNWNTTSFSTYLPITLAFSEKVGQILSELPTDSELENHYRFYM